MLCSVVQVPGQLLRQEDIGPELVGRRAEMLWPDDSQVMTMSNYTARLSAIFGIAELDET